MDDGGHHKGGQGKWGNCGPGCPIPAYNGATSVVVPDNKRKSK